MKPWKSKFSRPRARHGRYDAFGKHDALKEVVSERPTELERYHDISTPSPEKCMKLKKQGPKSTKKRASLVLQLLVFPVPNPSAPLSRDAMKGCFCENRDLVVQGLTKQRGATRGAKVYIETSLGARKGHLEKRSHFTITNQPHKSVLASK
jgi:hypothetical protein